MPNSHFYTELFKIAEISRFLTIQSLHFVHTVASYPLSASHKGKLWTVQVSRLLLATTDSPSVTNASIWTMKTPFPQELPFHSPFWMGAPHCCLWKEWTCVGLPFTASCQCHSDKASCVGLSPHSPLNFLLSAMKSLHLSTTAQCTYSPRSVKIKPARTWPPLRRVCGHRS